MNKKNLKKYGKPPFSIAVLHGGPGVSGEMAPVAIELSKSWGVLEPLQTAESLEGQVRELYDVLKKYGSLPVTLIGWSWGAMLGFIFTAKYPRMVKKLILVGSAVFEQKYADNITEIRLNRLDKEEKIEMQTLMDSMNNPLIKDKEKDILMSNLGRFLYKSDSYDPLPCKNEALDYQYNILGEKKYELCADFRTSNLEDDDVINGFYREIWPHKEGKQCIEKSIENLKEGLMPISVR